MTCKCRCECHEKEEKKSLAEKLREAYGEASGDRHRHYEAEAKAAIEHFCELVDEYADSMGWVRSEDSIRQNLKKKFLEQP